MSTIHENDFKYLLVGNPNCGKSTLFNRLTGLRQKTGNFHGVTVEKKTGFVDTVYGEKELWDLPGSYSLEGNSEDRKLTSDIILSRKQNDKIIFVMDSVQLERSFQFLISIIDTGAPILVVLTMKDILHRRKINIDIEKLSKITGLEFILINAKTGENCNALKDKINNPDNFKMGNRIWKFPAKEEKIYQKIIQSVNSDSNRLVEFAILQTLKYENNPNQSEYLKRFSNLFNPATKELIVEESKQGIFSEQEELVSKSIYIKKLVTSSVTHLSDQNQLSIDRADKVLLHPYFGVGIFLAIMALVFQFLFTWAEYPMDWIESGIGILQEGSKGLLPQGPLSSLFVDGILGGVGSVLVFIPQISLLFFFIGIMEESGYMARVSFVMDRFMGKFGLSGKSFIPLLSSAACAVPAIMGTRTIENKSDRMTTIMISPLVMCSARYPVYILVVGAVFTSERLFGIFNLQGFVLFLMFFLGLLTSLIFGLIFKRTLFRESASYFLMELPSYKMPSMLSIAQNVLVKIKAFLKNAGQIILYISILLWFISYYPIDDVQIQADSETPISTEIENASGIKTSYAAKIGKVIEPVIEPLGYDWKIGIALITSFAAREVMVSTLAVLYEIEDADEENPNLREAMLNDRNEKGEPLWTPLTGMSILVFFAFASQCMSTLAVVRKETNSYFWPSFQFAYMTILAYVSAFLVYQIGSVLGF
ncbi:ferrous iron transport protein B [Leptospira sp. GIMC2001]|uniref:ferrous iron transport protein B n=1 Tax=Leptospira sp. GIMC2001 TaxID=1513297 RepID=UPI00234B76D9|nr:ferrous iron transport protein B [Leptospira sp. GIMC2001]WCL48616.1 ferrous iron transport protein B [Leptospira sp. GIMC2001]